MYDSRVKVNLSVILGIETDQHPGNIVERDLKKIIIDNLADQISRFDDDNFESAIDSHEILESTNQDTDDTYERETTICAHRVTYRYWGGPITDDIKSALDEEAEKRAQQCIIENIVGGELNYENEDTSLSGWWEITKK